MVCAQTLNNNQSENGVINSTSQITGVDLYLDVTLNGNPVGWYILATIMESFMRELIP